MKASNLWLIPVCAALLWPAPAQAQKVGALFSGAYLMELCERDERGGEIVKGGHTACQAYIAGIIDYHNLLRSLGTSPSVDMCVPNSTDMDLIQDVVWVHLKENAQHEAFIAAPAVALALFEKFPCK